MITKLITIKPSDTVETAVHVMNENNISGVIVEPDSDGVWSMLTQNDVVTKVMHENKSPANVVVSDVANRPLRMVPVETSLHECVDIMSDNKIRRVIVEKDGAPLGIVTYSDVFRTVDKFGWVPVDL
ncbi:CBS domain-containing protein [Candidatus Albibeggiatoa sp. nov. NOAA]|uniref:CBS domain-containing protein n=1 Tax=Candidatus Albibeggiatoa sp. nov. NOAA TaxID=3162724 RepID=UPI0032FE906C|nr:CBS domain-containing protein [Thiotrichaceae bacterium]